MRLHSALFAGIAVVVLLGSLVLVIWRQGRVLETQRELSRIESARSVVEAESAALVLRMQSLESRGRVVPLARSRLGLRVPSSHEIVLLPLPGAALDRSNGE